MKTSVRPSLLYFRRDSYVVQDGVGGASVAPAADEPAPGAGPDAGTTIDCRPGYARPGAFRVVEEALRRFDPEAVWRYPEPGFESLLKPPILGRFQAAGIGPGQLFLGHGSFNLIERVIHKLLRADEMLGVGPQFTEVPSEFLGAGGAYRALPLDESGYRLPVAALEDALSGRPVSILYVDNPNNPTGQLFEREDLERLARSCERRGVVLLVDEAWGDFVDDSLSAIHLVGRHPNVIVVRSFSKALGLAGERVGYMFLSEPLARYYRQVDIPFEPGVVGATLARAVLEAPHLIEGIRRETSASKEAITRAFGTAGLTVLPTHPSVAILAVEGPSRNVVGELHAHGVRVLPGSCFALTHPRWDDSFCRVRIVERDLVEPLCRRIAAL